MLTLKQNIGVVFLMIVGTLFFTSIVFDEIESDKTKQTNELFIKCWSIYFCMAELVVLGIQLINS